ncbi:PEROXIDASE 25-RELATED [Salix koriyanagi]|uniref:Peroxidase n=1 Tax=Salix koriyanagi TaxID=2511006 RepID=A0A9Q0WCU6_9ROSI|nr:PEROXIDASE 25-RELATED [Salix koriyanagi]
MVLYSKLRAIVKKITERLLASNPGLPAALLRLHFHDCFVRGCDASVLIGSTANSKAEKDALPNLSLEGFDVIDEIKTELESKCAGKVSCADTLALAARDAVSFQFQKPMWEVLTGRRDGKVSLASEVLANIPSPFFNFSTLLKSFESKGLTVHDLVVLSGAHTIGDGHCNLFSNRLYNFTGKGDQDPSLDSTYAAFLKTKCRSLSDRTTTVGMDPGSSTSFDASYFVNLKQKKGLFQSDAALLTDRISNKIVGELQKSADFFQGIRTVHEKNGSNWGSYGQLRGDQKEVRRYQFLKSSYSCLVCLFHVPALLLNLVLFDKLVA